MKALLQRISRAEVRVGGRIIAAAGPGALVLAAIERQDDEKTVNLMAIRVLRWHLFADSRDRIALSLLDTGRDLLVVPQFTLAASGLRGYRPDFSPAAEPKRAAALYAHFIAKLQAHSGKAVASGEFGAYMEVESCNDGPVTFLLKETPAPERP